MINILFEITLKWNIAMTFQFGTDVDWDLVIARIQRCKHMIKAFITEAMSELEQYIMFKDFFSLSKNFSKLWKKRLQLMFHFFFSCIQYCACVKIFDICELHSYLVHQWLVTIVLYFLFSQKVNKNDALCQIFFFIL